MNESWVILEPDIIDLLSLDRGCDLFPALVDSRIMGELSGTKRSGIPHFRELLGFLEPALMKTSRSPCLSECVIEGFEKASESKNRQ